MGRGRGRWRGGWVEDRVSDPYEGGSVRAAQQLLEAGALPTATRLARDLARAPYALSTTPIAGGERRA